MPYRSRTLALADEADAIERELSALQGPDRVAALHRERIMKLSQELDRVTASLGSSRPLVRLRLASPCPRSWDSMRGNERVRFCDGCRQHVYNLSGLTSREAMALLAKNGGKLCGRAFRRWDGSVSTRDCPRRGRQRLLIGTGLVLGVAVETALVAPTPRPLGMMVVEEGEEEGAAPAESVDPWDYELEEVPEDLGESLSRPEPPPPAATRAADGPSPGAAPSYSGTGEALAPRWARRK